MLTFVGVRLGENVERSYKVPRLPFASLATKLPLMGPPHFFLSVLQHCQTNLVVIDSPIEQTATSEVPNLFS